MTTKVEPTVEKNGYICPFGCGKLVKFEELHKCKSGSVDHKDEKCKHCGYPISQRNPSGYCDHLYYPENCKTCSGSVDSSVDTPPVSPSGQSSKPTDPQISPPEEWVETIEKRYSECIDYRIKPELIQFIRSLLSTSNEKTRKEVLEKLLEKGHGGGNWRQLIYQLMPEEENYE